MSLYYLISSLPMLSFGEPPPFTPAVFLEACRAQLSEGDAATVEALLDGTPSDHPFVEAWLCKESILRNTVVQERARRGGGEAARWLRPICDSDTGVESMVEDAFQEADPMKREKALDQVRWRIADELQGYDPLDVKVVFAYAAKLALLSRWTKLTADDGRKSFEALSEISIVLNTDH